MGHDDWKDNGKLRSDTNNDTGGFVGKIMDTLGIQQLDAQLPIVPDAAQVELLNLIRQWEN